MTDRLSEEEKQEIVRSFWRKKEEKREELQRRHDRIRQAAERANDPEERRLLGWAAEHWDLLEILVDEWSEGILGEAFAVLPLDLRSDLDRVRIAEKQYSEYTPQQRERIEFQVIYNTEKQRFGEVHPETEERMRELDERHRRSRTMTAERLHEINRRLVEALGEDDPRSPDE